VPPPIRRPILLPAHRPTLLPAHRPTLLPAHRPIFLPAHHPTDRTGTMIRVTLQAIAAHWTRLVAATVAVALGVAFVVASFVLVDTFERSTDDLFAATVAGVDLVVALRDQTGPEGTRERFPDTVADRIAAVPGVADARGVVWGPAQFVRADGTPVRTGRAPTLATSWTSAGGTGPFRPVGPGDRAPEGPDEVAVDLDTARANGFALGDRVRVAGIGPARDYRVVGRFRVGDRDRIGGVTLAAFDLATAQAVVGAPGAIDAVHVTRAGGPPGVRDRILDRVGPGFEVRRAAAAAGDAGDALRTLLARVGAVLFGVAVVGVVVAALLVANTFAVVVTQRARDLARLRVLGASRTQVVGAVTGEALVVGVVGTALGGGLGVGAAAVLADRVARLGFVPGGPVVEPRTLFVAAGLGVAVSVGAALVPAVRAARAAPLAALTAAETGSPGPRAPRRARTGLGWVGVAVGAALLARGALGDPAGRTGPAVMGAGVLLVAVAALLPGWVGTLAARRPRAGAGTVARPAGGTGRVPARLARAQAARDPRRIAAPATAVAVGLAVMTAVAVVGASARASVGRAVDRGVRAELVLRAAEFGGFSPEVASAVAAVPGVTDVTPWAFRSVRVADPARPGTTAPSEVLAGTDAAGLAETVDLGLRSGTFRALEPAGILVQADAARARGLAVGDPVVVPMARGSFRLAVAGVYDRADVTGGLPVTWIVPRSVYTAGFGTDEPDTLVHVATTGPVDAVAARVRDRLRDAFPTVEVRTRSEYRADQVRAVDRYLAVTAALLLLALGIAVLGIANACVLGVVTRTRELGLLRAVGMTPGQVRATVRTEAVLIATVGAVVGIGVGLAWGVAFVGALRAEGLTVVAVPGPALLGGAGAALLAAIVAAALPARRAARLDVLAAIARP
jgi:putative ABC transport system permease protein